MTFTFKSQEKLIFIKKHTYKFYIKKSFVISDAIGEKRLSTWVAIGEGIW